MTLKFPFDSLALLLADLDLVLHYLPISSSFELNRVESHLGTENVMVADQDDLSVKKFTFVCFL